MQELKWKVPLPHEQRDINDKEGTCETARPGGRALQKGRKPLVRVGEDTRPYGPHPPRFAWHLSLSPLAFGHLPLKRGVGP